MLQVKAVEQTSNCKATTIIKAVEQTSNSKASTTVKAVEQTSNCKASTTVKAVEQTSNCKASTTTTVTVQVQQAYYIMNAWKLSIIIRKPTLAHHAQTGILPRTISMSSLTILLA